MPAKHLSGSTPRPLNL